MYIINDVSQLVGRLNSIGAQSLARRMRGLSRVRGAHAHPDIASASEIDDALAEGGRTQVEASSRDAPGATAAVSRGLLRSCEVVKRLAVPMAGAFRERIGILARNLQDTSTSLIR